VARDTYLSGIVAAHRAAAAADTRRLADLRARAADAPAPRGFAARLSGHAASGGLSVIAEIKRRSPSKGDIDPGLDPAALAAEYEAGGASCLSVLTDAEYFGAIPDDLEVARASCALPVLRKDFTVSEADVYDARIMGADAVLLIVAALDDHELSALHAAAVGVGLDALVEVHDAGELERALEIGAVSVGVNQRDLHSFTVDRRRALSLAGAIPQEVVAVAESGIDGAREAAVLAAAGYQAVLVGESLLRAGDRRAAVSALRGHPVGRRAAAAAAGSASAGPGGVGRG